MSPILSFHPAFRQPLTSGSNFGEAQGAVSAQVYADLAFFVNDTPASFEH
jgi:hypothetical protein